MTVHDLHDALNELPSDLIMAADRVRTAPAPKVIHWQRWVSLAAVLALVVGTTLVFQKNIGLERMKGTGAVPESAMQQAPAAAAPMAPAPVEDEVTADEAVPEEPAAEAPKAAGSTTNSPAMDGDEKPMEEELMIDHSHRFAESEEGGRSTGAYCGNMEVTIEIAGQRHVISGSDAVKVTDILVNLSYDPDQVCRCMTDITVDTETLAGIQLNTAEGFARCEKGQAALTEEQARILQGIIDNLQ